MKPYRFVILLLLTLIVSFANAQITITSTDTQKRIGTTETSYRYVSLDTTGLNAIIANAGANRSWNIANRMYFAPETSYASLRTYPGGAPLANDPAFSGSTLVVSAYSARYPKIRVWEFSALDNSGLYVYGDVLDSAGVKFSKFFTFSPRAQVHKYPLTFGTAWTVSTTATDLLGNQIQFTYQYSVDGYGTITTPEGLFSCLRLKQIITYVSGGVTGTSTYYFFVDGKRYYADILSQSSGPVDVEYYRTTSTPTAVQSSDLAPIEFQLAQNYPNPFNPSTTIEYSLTENSHVRLAVFNTLGQEVAILVNEPQAVGYHRIRFDGAGLPSGVYLYRLSAEGKVKVGRMSLVK